MFRVFRRSLPLALLLLGASTASGATPPGGVLLSSQPYRLAPWDSLARPERSLTRDDYESARGDADLELRRVTYASGGLEVSAIVATSRGGTGRRRPVVLFCRGGYTVGDVGWQYAAFFHHLASAGFLVVAPMLRGSDGAAGHDAMGGEDLDDLLRAVPVAHALNGDTTALHLCGESRGGAMTYLALRRGVPARAAAVWGAFTDLDSLMEGDPATYARLGPVVWPDWGERRAEIAESRSAARWAAEIATPLLILHGGADRQLPIAHPLRLADGLERAGREYRLVIMGGESHRLKGKTAERDAAIAAWFRAHAPAGVPSPRRAR